MIAKIRVNLKRVLKAKTRQHLNLEQLENTVTLMEYRAGTDLALTTNKVLYSLLKRWIHFKNADILRASLEHGKCTHS